MTNWRIPSGGTRIATAGGDTSDTSGVTVTAHASGATKGSYSELIASTAFDADWLFIAFTGDNSTRSLIDLAIGAGGSEVVIIENLLHDSEGSIANGQGYFLPIFIAAGSRLAVRMQSAVGGVVIECVLVYGKGGFGMQQPFSRVITLGADTMNTTGTNLGDGSSWTAHTKKAYQELVSSLAANIDALTIAFNTPGTAADNDRNLYDFAVGAAASEQIIIADFMTVVDSQSGMTPSPFGPIPLSIAAGTRIAARTQISVARAAAAGDRYVILYGFVR